MKQHKNLIVVILLLIAVPNIHSRGLDYESRKKIATCILGTAIGLGNEYLYKHYYKKASCTKSEFRLVIPWIISFLSRDILCSAGNEFFGTSIYSHNGLLRNDHLRAWAFLANWICYLYNDDDHLRK